MTHDCNRQLEEGTFEVTVASTGVEDGTKAWVFVPHVSSPTAPREYWITKSSLPLVQIPNDPVAACVTLKFKRVGPPGATDPLRSDPAQNLPAFLCQLGGAPGGAWYARAHYARPWACTNGVPDHNAPTHVACFDKTC